MTNIEWKNGQENGFVEEKMEIYRAQMGRQSMEKVCKEYDGDIKSRMAEDDKATLRTCAT